MYMPEEITIVALALRLIKCWICQMCDYTLEDSRRKMKRNTLGIAKQYKLDKALKLFIRKKEDSNSCLFFLNNGLIEYANFNISGIANGGVSHSRDIQNEFQPLLFSSCFPFAQAEGKRVDNVTWKEIACHSLS